MGNPNINVNVSGPVQPSSIYKTVVLKGNQSFASQITEPNTKYVIKHNFDLSSGSIVYDGWDIEGMGGNPSIIDGEEYWLTDYESGITEPTIYTLVDDEYFFVIDGHISDVKEVTLQYEENAWIATKRRGYHSRILSHYDTNVAITIPSNCVLAFDGGGLSNGKIIGNNTVILSIGLNNIPLDNVTTSGTFKQLATVAVTGNYNDLNNKPTIPAAQVQSDWNVSDNTSKAYIKNKPDIPTIPENNATWDGGESFPTEPIVGEMYLYTPAGGTAIPVWWNGTEWVDATGTPVTI